MAGLVELAMEDTGTTPQGDEFLQAGTTGYEADLSEVNAPTDTVAGQMDTILDKESPYITRARTAAAEAANARGLINSSMAAGAGEAAAIDAALPIASQDANTYSTTRLTNQASKNRSFEFGAGSKNAASAFNAGQGNQLVGQRLSGTQALEQIGASGEQTRLNIGAQTQAASTLSAQEYQQQLGTMAFGEEINTRMATLQSSLAESMAKLNADLQAGVIMQADFDIRSRLLQQQQGYQLETMSRQAALNQQMAKLQADLETGQILPAQFEQQKALLDKQLAASLTLQASQQDFSIALQQLKGEQATSLADIEAQYKTLVQTSASAASFFSDATKMLTAILADPNTSQEQKDASTAALADQLASGLAVIGSIADLDLNALLDFGTA